MAGFVIEYNRRTGERRVTEYLGADGHRQALRRRLALEAERASMEWEIASLTSDSLATVEKTHSRYFMNDLASAQA